MTISMQLLWGHLETWRCTSAPRKFVKIETSCLFWEPVQTEHKILCLLPRAHNFSQQDGRARSRL